jgi:hypothetical protein
MVRIFGVSRNNLSPPIAHWRQAIPPLVRAHLFFLWSKSRQYSMLPSPYHEPITRTIPYTASAIALRARAARLVAIAKLFSSRRGRAKTGGQPTFVGVLTTLLIAPQEVDPQCGSSIVSEAHERGYWRQMSCPEHCNCCHGGTGPGNPAGAAASFAAREH